NMLAAISEYSDRSRSVYFSSGIHMRGQGITYFLNHEFGDFGVLIMYLVPLLFLTAPIFADEYVCDMYKIVDTTVNGRYVDVFIKMVLVILVEISWLVFHSIIFCVIDFCLFDNGISSISANISQIARAAINIGLGSFCMENIFMFISSCVKNTVTAFGLGMALIVLPMFVESGKIWIQYFPSIGMQAECMLQRSKKDNGIIWIFYVLMGLLFFFLILVEKRFVARLK
ncbi:MAG: hypothetical protein K6F84_02420, partial [Lachnospiraceae bacterium]|nr:hypothetical protein [Lachnospiraceae bacterium]